MSTFQKPAEREFPILTAAVCAICVLIFIAMNMGLGDTVASARRFGLYTEQEVFRGAYWAVVTMVFVHRETLHLLFNLYWFWILGGIFERRFGIPSFAAFFLFAALVSSGLEFALGHLGIGLSGVGYALFGFAWIARTRVPELARALPDQMVYVFLGWAALCLVLTQLKIMNVANMAHLGGLAFGALVGKMYVSEDRRALAGMGLVALLCASLVPLFWNPLSVDWVSVKAVDSFRRGDLSAAERYYKRSLNLGQDPAWAWQGLAAIYGYRHERAAYSDALNKLKSIDQDAAEELVQEFGEPQ